MVCCWQVMTGQDMTCLPRWVVLVVSLTACCGISHLLLPVPRRGPPWLTPPSAAWCPIPCGAVTRLYPPVRRRAAGRRPPCGERTTPRCPRSTRVWWTSPRPWWTRSLPPPPTPAAHHSWGASTRSARWPASGTPRPPLHTVALPGEWTGQTTTTTNRRDIRMMWPSQACTIPKSLYGRISYCTWFQQLVFECIWTSSPGTETFHIYIPTV